MRYPAASHTAINCRRISDLKPSTAQWLWPGWLPLGLLTLLEGDPGVGKSLLTLDLCARLTRGQAWPDGAAAGPPENVVLLNAEDPVETVVRPRLLALGADLDRAYFAEGIIDRHGEAPLSLPTHLVALRDLVVQTRARLVVVDPLVAFLDPKVASHSDHSVRRVLSLLAGLAAEQACAVLLVRHLNKNQGQRALYRGSGSIGFLAAVRCAWLVAAAPAAAPGLVGSTPIPGRVLAQVKNNLGALSTSQSFSVTGSVDQGPSLTWLGASPLDPTQLLEHKTRRGRPRTKSERLEENLRLYLEEEPRVVADVYDFLGGQRASERTLLRVKKSLGIRSMRGPHGESRATYWLLPGQLPLGATEAMLTPVETHEQELAAAQEDSDQIMAELRRKFPG